jgi:filamentous hemagglutinin family protein
MRKFFFNQILNISFNLGLKIATSLSIVGFTTTPVFAQSDILPDSTLGTENSNVVTNFNNLPVEVITGGATRGINLFHSFREFNVSEGRSTYFLSPGADIQNILARVTGVNRSEILGRLGTFQITNGNITASNASLFLINPNGIVFGKNASLDLQGSFVATTANAVQFGEQGVFSATNPEVPQLLRVNPSAFLFNQINQNAGIQNNSKAPAGQNSIGGNVLGLRVPDGKSLLLVGGNVNMDGGQLNTFGGQIELGGLAEPGNINLVVDGDNLKLGFPENGIRADVSLTNQAGVFVTGVGGGNLAINAGNIDILNGSILSAGIISGRGTPGTVGGNIKLNATGEITVADGSLIGNLVGQNSQGQGGNITIEAGSFQLRDGALLTASTVGQGNAGSVKITTTDAVFLTGNAAIFSRVELGGVGKGGNIDINAASLSLTDGAQLTTSTRDAFDTQLLGKGDAGNVNVKVSGEVDIAGVENGFSSGIFSTVDTGTEGNGGNITIEAGSFQLRDGAQLSASTSGQGDAGSVKITATDAVSLAGASILSTVEAGGVGKGGNIDIDAASLSLTDGAQLVTATSRVSATQPPGKGDAGNVNVKVSGKVDIAGVKNGIGSGIGSRVETGTVGNGGNITIEADSFQLRDGSQLTASTSGQGDAGSVKITATDAVSLAGASILSTVNAGAMGKGGNIDIDAASLSLTDGAQLATVTLGASDTQPPGKGDAGNVNVKVFGQVDIAGVKNGLLSGIFSFVDTGTEKNGGNITIEAGSFQLRDGAQLAASTSGQGNAGSVKVTATDAVSLTDNATILTTVEAGAVGKGGNIDIDAASLSLTDGAQLATFTRGASATQPPGKGDAGNVNVKVSGEVDIAGVKNGFSSGIRSLVLTDTEGNGGNITIEAGSFQLRDGALITASTFGQGNAGSVKVTANNFVNISGKGGDLLSGLYVNSASLTGKAGDVTVKSPKITLDESGTLNAESTSGNGGNININSNLLLLRRGSQITTTAGTAQAGGDGGNININSRFIVAIPNENTDITANAYTGKGGNINIQSRGIFGIEPRTQASDITNDITASSQLGVSGNINVNSPDNSSIQNSLTELPINAIDTNALIANSCIARANKKQENSFIITGGGALPNRPGDVSMSNYSTDTVRGITDENTSRPWKKGDRIIEPTGVYRTASGELILSRKCQ